MKRAICKLKSTSPVAFCRPYVEEPYENESKMEFEKRTWRERGHYSGDEEAFIPSIMFKKSIEAGAKFLNMKIPGEGNATYTKNFKAGIFVENNIPLNTFKADIIGDWQFVPADGKPNTSGPRVHKCFPQVNEWEGTLAVTILDDKITEDVFAKVLKAAGTFIGVGRFRPINGGDKGRFTFENIEFENI